MRMWMKHDDTLYERRHGSGKNASMIQLTNSEANEPTECVEKGRVSRPLLQIVITDSQLTFNGSSTVVPIGT
jgi:hypothetical protein